MVSWQKLEKGAVSNKEKHFLAHIMCELTKSLPLFELVLS